MLSTLELDYVQHLERGYCENHPDVIAQTKEQVVDRAVKQLLTALQSNGFELDGNVLKRGNGWLRYDATAVAWQYSNDAGVAWHDMGSGSDLPAELDSPATIGDTQIQDNEGYLEISHDSGVTWETVIDTAQDISMDGKKFYPPFIAQETEPSTFNGSITFWKQSSTGLVWLLYKDVNSIVQKVFLSNAAPLFRIEDDTPEVSIDGATWFPIYQVGYTELHSSYFVPPMIAQATQPTDSDPALANSGSVAIWDSTVDSKIFLLYSNGVTIKKVELT